MIRGRLVCGISNNIVRKLLLREDDLTLAKVIQMCQVNKLSEQRNKELTNQLVEGTKAEIHNLRKKRLRNYKRQQVVQRQVHCRYCGRKHIKQHCPSYGKQCRDYEKTNHFQKVFRSSGLGKENPLMKLKISILVINKKTLLVKVNRHLLSSQSSVAKW